jgi:hypothetical protein
MGSASFADKVEFLGTKGSRQNTSVKRPEVIEWSMTLLLGLVVKTGWLAQFTTGKMANTEGTPKKVVRPERP